MLDWRKPTTVSIDVIMYAILSVVSCPRPVWGSEKPCEAALVSYWAVQWALRALLLWSGTMAREGLTEVVSTQLPKPQTQAAYVHPLPDVVTCMWLSL